MARPTELRTCFVQKNGVSAMDVSTPDGPVTAQRGDYIVTDAAGGQWVFTTAQLKALAGVRPIVPDPHPEPTPPS